MNIDQILDALDDLIDEAWTLPLSGGRRMLDGEKVRGLIDDMRLNLPTEVRQAKAIVADRTEIITTAREEADAIVAKAEEKARRMVDEAEIVRLAQEKASEILGAAQRNARELRSASSEFADNVMKKTEEYLLLNLSEVKATRQEIRNRKPE